MFLKIKKEKVRYVAILNGEPILIKIEDVSTDGNIMTVKTGMFVESEYLEKGDNAKRGHIVNVSNTFSVDPNQSTEGTYTTVAVKLVKEKLKELLNLTDDDFTILSEIEWRNTPQTIRLTIPIDQVIENSFYRGLTQELIDAGIIYYKVKNNYILYLTYILKKHREILESDPNLIIEEK